MRTSTPIELFCLACALALPAIGQGEPAEPDEPATTDEVLFLTVDDDPLEGTDVRPQEDAESATDRLGDLRFEDAEVDDAPAESLVEALGSGRLWLNARYRFEAAELRGTPKRGFASTLRGALGYETAEFEGFRGLVELESVVHLVEDAFNDSANGMTSRAFIPDPDGTELNQLYLTYGGVERLDVRLGRQEISIGNERFVGADPWRQNHQSFDALRVRYEISEAVDVDYSLATKVHRVFGRQSPFGAEGLQAHFLDVSANLEGWGHLAGYGILVDFDDTKTQSSNTFGARYEAGHTTVLPQSFPGRLSGRDLDLGLRLEYAQQKDAHGNPIDVDADYHSIDASAEIASWRFSIGMETLGGSGVAGDKFSTPFASYQTFNGFADQFRVTPDAGLEDRSIGFAYSSDAGFLPLPATFSATYHWFGSDAGDIDYGRELDLDVVIPLSARASVGARYADFNRDEIYRNANRAMVWASFRLL